MRITIAFIIVLFFTQPGLTQAPSKTQKPVKNQMQGQMAQAINELNKQIVDLEKQIAEAKKNKEDEATIQELESRASMLKKQVTMMQGVNKSLSGISEKTFEKAGEEEPGAPMKDVARINMLPKSILTEIQLSLFLKNVHTQVEKMIPVEEKAEALKVYNETKAKYKSLPVTANAASGCWMLGHWEKALYIMGKVCMDDISDADNLNNYAAFLISTGAEQAAIPILAYLDNKYPNNSTIKNNIGQAWFGLGDMNNAKKHLDETTLLYPGHSTANTTLSNVYRAEGDNERAISFLKASLKETYDPEKEQQLLRLGYKITYADMPPFDYPMKKDPLGLITLLDTWSSSVIQKSIADEPGASALQKYLNGIDNFDEELNNENIILDRQIEERNEKLSTDKAYRQEFLEPYNCPAFLQAARSLQLLTFDVASGTSPLITQMLLPFPKTLRNPGEIPLSIDDIIRDCQKVWDDEVLKPIAELSRGLMESMAAAVAEDCRVRDIFWDSYLSKRAEIYKRGVDLIKNEFVLKSKRLDAWITLHLYSINDDPPKTDDDLTKALISHLKKKIARTRFKNKMYKGMTMLIDAAKIYSDVMKSVCDEEKTATDPGIATLRNENVQVLDCEFQKSFITPIRYEFMLVCNTVLKKTDGNIEERKPDINKGSVQNSTPTNQNPGPLQTPGGPYNSFNVEEQKPNIQSGPLTAENKVISQSYIEFNKWGNLVGFKFQLNEDGTTLKDPDSIESGVDSRWSWNAIASVKKGFLNKLVAK